MCRHNSQVRRVGGCGGERLVEAVDRTQDIRRTQAEMVGHPGGKTGDSCVNGLRRRAGETSRERGGGAVAGGQTIIEMHFRGLPVRVDIAVQGRGGGAHGGGRAGGGRRSRCRVNGSWVSGGVVRRAHIAAAGDGCGVGDGSGSGGRHVHSDGNGRIGRADGQGIGTGAGDRAQVRGPTGAANRRDREGRGSVSATVTVPLEAAVPTFVTVTV